MGGQLKESIISSSLQILRLIVAAEKRSVKTVWSLIGVVCLIVFSVMFAQSLMFFLQYPVGTTVWIQEGPLEFPAVSVCSLNPYKTSSLKSKAPQLYEAISNYSRLYLENEAAGRVARDTGEQHQAQEPDDVLLQRKPRAVISPGTMNSKGRTFYLTFFPDAFSQPTNPSILLATTLPSPFTVTITNKGGGYATTNITIDDTKVYEVIIDTKKVDWQTGFRLTADFEFAAYTMQWRQNSAIKIVLLTTVNAIMNSADATMLIPLEALGTEYVDIGYTTVDTPSYLYIVGTVDDTDVTVTSPSGVKKSYTADEMDVIQVSSTIDYSGYRIESSAPIAVFTAVDCLSYPFDCGGCDQVFEQLPPVISMGTRYALVPFQHLPATITQVVTCASNAAYNLRTYELFKVVAIFDGTTVTRTGTITSDATFSLDAGEAKEILARPNEYSLLTSSQPVVVVQLMQAYNYAGVAEQGDAALLVIPPIEDYHKDYFIISCNTRFTTHYFTVVIDQGQASGLLLNGAPFIASITPNPIPKTNLCAYQYPVDCTDGDSFLITHPDPLAVYSVVAYGRGYVMSYAYNAGRLFHKEQLTTTSSTTTTTTQATTTGTTTTDASTTSTSTSTSATSTSTTAATTNHKTSTLPSTTTSFSATTAKSTTAKVTTVTSSATSPNASTTAETTVAETTSNASTTVPSTNASTRTGTSSVNTSPSTDTVRTTSTGSTAGGNTSVLTTTAGTTTKSTTSTALETSTVAYSSSPTVPLTNATSPTSVEATTAASTSVFTSTVIPNTPTSSSGIGSSSASSENSSTTTRSTSASIPIMLISTSSATSTASPAGFESTSSLTTSTLPKPTIGSSAITSSVPFSSTATVEPNITSSSSVAQDTTTTATTTPSPSPTSVVSNVPTSFPSSTSTESVPTTRSSSTSVGTSSLEQTTEKSTSTVTQLTSTKVPSSTVTQPPSSTTTSSATSPVPSETSTHSISSTSTSLETSSSSSTGTSSATSASSPASSESSSQESSVTSLPTTTQAPPSTSSTLTSVSDSSTLSSISIRRSTEASTSVSENISTSSADIRSTASSSGGTTSAVGTTSTVIATSTAMHTTTSIESASEPVSQSTMAEEYSTIYLDSSAATSEHFSSSEAKSLTTKSLTSAASSEVLSTAFATSPAQVVTTTMFENTPSSVQSSAEPVSHEPSDPSSTSTTGFDPPTSADISTSAPQSSGPSTDTTTSVADPTTAETSISISTLESTSVEAQTPLASDSISTVQATPTEDTSTQPSSFSVTLTALTTDELLTVVLESLETTTDESSTTTLLDSIPTVAMTSSSTSGSTTTVTSTQPTGPSFYESSTASVSSSMAQTEGAESYSVTSAGRFKIKKTNPTIGPTDPHDDSLSTSTLTTVESSTTAVPSSLKQADDLGDYSTTSRKRNKIKKTDPTIGPPDPHDDSLSTSTAFTAVRGRMKVKKTDPTIGPADPHDDSLSTSTAYQQTTVESSSSTEPSNMAQSEVAESESTTSRERIKIKKTDPTVGPADPHDDSLSTSTAHQSTTVVSSTNPRPSSWTQTAAAEVSITTSRGRMKIKMTDPTIGPQDPHDDSLSTTTVQEFRNETTSAIANSDAAKTSLPISQERDTEDDEFTTTHLSTETSDSSQATSSTTLLIEASESIGSSTQATITLGQTSGITTLHPDQPASTTTTVEDHATTRRGQSKLKRTDPTVGPPEPHDDHLATSSEHETDHVSTSIPLELDTTPTLSEQPTAILTSTSAKFAPALQRSDTTSTTGPTVEVTSQASPKRRRIPLTDPTPMLTDPHEGPLYTTATRFLPEQSEETVGTTVKSTSTKTTSSTQTNPDWVEKRHPAAKLIHLTASPVDPHDPMLSSTTTEEQPQRHEETVETMQQSTTTTTEYATAAAVDQETSITAQFISAAAQESAMQSTTQALGKPQFLTAESNKKAIVMLATDLPTLMPVATAASTLHTTADSMQSTSYQTATASVSSLDSPKAGPDTWTSPPLIQAASGILHKRPVTKPDSPLTLPSRALNAEPTAAVATDSQTAAMRNQPSTLLQVPQVPQAPTQPEQLSPAPSPMTSPDEGIPSVQYRTVLDVPAPPPAVESAAAAPTAMGDGNFPKPMELTGLLPWASEMEDSLAYFVNMYGIDPSLLGYDLDEFIFWCRYDGRKCNFSTEITTFIDPSYGNCFTFNPKTSTHYSQRGGQRLGLRVIFHTPSSEYLPFILPSGYKVVLHEPDEAPMMSISGVTCSPGQYYSFSMFKIDNKRMEEPYQQCDKNLTTTNPAYFTNKSYSIETCMGSCYQKMMLDKCSCGDPHYPLPPGGLHCNITQKPCIDKAATESISMSGCSCQPACKSTTFTFSQSKSIWPSYQWTPPTCELDANPGQCLKQFKSSYSRVDVFYGSMTGIKMEAYAQYTLMQLISDTFANSGLWLAICAISVFEMILLPIVQRG